MRQPLVCGFIFLETILILPLGEAYVSRLYWAYKFILNVTVLILPLDTCVHTLIVTVLSLLQGV